MDTGARASATIPILLFAVPVGLWLQFGSLAVLTTVAVVAGSALVSWASVRLIARTIPAVAMAPLEQAATAGGAAPCAGATGPCHRGHPGPVGAPRPLRDVRCGASGRPLDRRRRGQRRTRP